MLVLAIVALSAGWKRQAQLDRLALMLAVAAVLPASSLCGRILRPAQGWAYRRICLPVVIQAALLAILVMGQRTAYMHIANRGGSSCG